ncbi:MAG: hypothetical protein U0990_10850 [Candidatus Nanopelagicales bacterium]|nr:hypothetical protein [Candidatus Nanopelagicales bacterium]MDZ4250564.1 hypothetical protein [Candidatus Nanopelagicales bacterium]
MLRSAFVTKAVVPLSATGLLFVGMGVPASGAVDTESDSQASSYAPSVRAVKAKGKVKKAKGMTLLTMSRAGYVMARKILKKKGNFSLRVRDGSSLHLITRDGVYAGPLVLAKSKKGKRAHIYLKSVGSGVNIGKVKVLNGYAKVKSSKKLRKKLARKANFAVGASALAKKGRPKGARHQGVVSVKKKMMLQKSAASKRAADLDRDGYVNVFDLDANGNRVLNNVDKTNRHGKVRVPATLKSADAFTTLAEPPPPGGGGLMLFSNYKATSPNLSDVINANLFAPGTSVAVILTAIDASLAAKTTLAIQSIPGGDYECTMPYCPKGSWSAPAGGTGDFQWNIGAGSVPGGIPAYPGLKHTEIGGGDTIIAEDNNGTKIPGVLNFAFVTTPALQSYTTYDAAGTAVESGVIDYDAGVIKGSTGDPIHVPAGGTVRLVWYVPQRMSMSGESGFGPNGIFVNQGLLNYYADLPNRPAGVAGSAKGGNCQSFKDMSSGAALPGEFVTDGTGDTAGTGRVFAWRMSIDDCVDDMWTGQGAAWTTADFDIKAQSPNGGDNGAQKLFFARS